jgi:hypothetical protein
MIKSFFGSIKISDKIKNERSLSKWDHLLFQNEEDEPHRTISVGLRKYPDEGGRISESERRGDGETGKSGEMRK